MSSRRHTGFGIDRRTFLGTGAVAAAGLFAGGASLAFGQDMRLTSVGGTVLTRHGRVRGLLKDGVHQFWGVPYGASTAGANRFMPPQKPTAWTGVRDAFQVGQRSPQAPGAGEPSPVVLAMNRLVEEGEDCLNLAVFTPGLDNRTRPVMVWMHGGGFAAGSGEYLMYDGTNLAKKEDVVVVSVNHRLNLFGFLHLADLGGDKWARSTNVGAQDLVATLEWVRDNIEQFGGDPGNVTIFGQSGGGGKTTTIMATPSAEGLFHRCVAQSGSALRGVPATNATEATERYLAKLGIRADQLDRLQQLSVQQIQDAFYSEPRIQQLGGGPVIDGTIIPRHQWDPSAPSFSANVPLMAGSTETENGWVGPPPFDLSDADMASRFARLAGNDAAKGQSLLELYKRLHPTKRNQMLWLTAEADNSRRWNAQTLNRLKAEQGGAPAYLYFFNWHSPVHDNRMGAYHTLDIPFVFYNVDVCASMTGASQYRYQLAHVMSAAWASFARTGNPNHADMPNWPAFNASTYPTMVFGEQVKVVNDPNKEERLALAGLRAGQTEA
ncbi:MAG: carboxylesterase/lipase family protein [Acidobacteria bacterium]|nr:carboxylesterase/lipase family protein [Acidobacteriota bacterium]